MEKVLANMGVGKVLKTILTLDKPQRSSIGENMKIAITGATGQLGRLVIEKLKTKGFGNQTVALARTLSKASDLGIPIRQVDYSKPETLAEGLTGIDVLLLISSNEIGQRELQHHNVIEAAKKAGIKRVVYTSLLHADTSPLNLAGEHLATEAELTVSGIPCTLLRNGWYTENYTGSIAGAIAGGAFIGSAGEGRISSVPRSDLAEAAAVVLSTEGHEGKTYELAADEAYTLTDLAAEITRQTGKNIPYRNLPEAEYAATLTSLGLPEDFAKLLASWDTGASKDALFDDSHQLSKLIGRPTTLLSKAVADALSKSKL